MKAVRLHRAGDPATLKLEEIDAPRPAAGELLIRVIAAGVTPSELGWYPTAHDRNGGSRTLPVPGHEFSGIVEAVGEGVAKTSLGDSVYGMNDWFRDGAMAGFCLTNLESVAPKPRTLDHAGAAAVPIGALTAWQGLFDRAALEPGERLVVHGGAGAVGTFAVQLGRWRGAHVIATASAANSEFVRGLGAMEVVDSRTGLFEDEVGKVDVVFDTVGGETLRRSWDVLESGGRMVTIASSVSAGTNARDKSAFFIVEPKRSQLARVAELIDAAALRPFVEAVVPLSEAADAFAGRAASHPHRGKVVVRIDAEP